MLPRVKSRQSIIWWSTGGVLALFALTGLIGALVKTGQPQGPWRVDLVSAQVSVADSPLQRTDPANRWLVVKAKVQVTADSTATGLASMLRLSEVDGLVNQEPKVMLLRDGTIIDRLHPGLPEELTFSWEQRAATPAPQRLTLRVSGGAPVEVPVTAS